VFALLCSPVRLRPCNALAHAMRWPLPPPFVMDAGKGITKIIMVDYRKWGRTQGSPLRGHGVTGRTCYAILGQTHQVIYFLSVPYRVYSVGVLMLREKIHPRNLESRREFPTTLSELRAMAAAENMG